MVGKTILTRPSSRRKLVPHVKPRCLGENWLRLAAECLRGHHLGAGVLDRPVCPRLPPGTCLLLGLLAPGVGIDSSRAGADKVARLQIGRASCRETG